MKCPHCNKDIADRLVLSQAAAISNRRSRRSLQRGHSKTDKRTNFGEQGVKRVVEAEALLASMYCGPHERPYDVLAATYQLQSRGGMQQVIDTLLKQSDGRESDIDEISAGVDFDTDYGKYRVEVWISEVKS